MDKLTTAALAIKDEIYSIIGSWGIAAILAVLEFRVLSELAAGEYDEVPEEKLKALQLVKYLHASQNFTD